MSGPEKEGEGFSDLRDFSQSRFFVIVQQRATRFYLLNRL